MKAWAASIAAAAILAWGGAAWGEPAPGSPRAFAFFDQNPTTQIYGLPRAGGYAVLQRGRQRLTFHLSQSSHFLEQHNASESLLFDGATTRAALAYARGLGHGWQFRLTVPFVAHSGGFADDWITDFHHAFGFQASERSQVPNGRQRFVYSRNGHTRMRVDTSPSGIGDVRLTLKKHIADIGSWGASVATQLKLPTGDADELTGSGGTDLALWGVVGNNRVGLSPWRVLMGAGVLLTSDGDVLPDMRRNVAGFGWFVLGYALTPTVVLRAQLYLHSAFYEDTELEALAGTAVQGAFGVDWHWTDRSSLSLAFIEDFNSGVTPDVALLMAIGYRF